MNEPRDYSVAAEPATEHLRNALTMLDATLHTGYPAYPEHLEPIRARVAQALALLERPQ